MISTPDNEVEILSVAKKWVVFIQIPSYRAWAFWTKQELKNKIAELIDAGSDFSCYSTTTPLADVVPDADTAA
jgi:hypothetical protein